MTPIALLRADLEAMLDAPTNGAIDRGRIALDSAADIPALARAMMVAGHRYLTAQGLPLPEVMHTSRDATGGYCSIHDVALPVGATCNAGPHEEKVK